MKRLVRRIYGVPPPRDAPLLAKLLYARRVAYYCNTLPLAIVLTMIAAWFSSPLNWIFPLLLGGLWLEGVAAITLRIRRERGGS